MSNDSSEPKQVSNQDNAVPWSPWWAVIFVVLVYFGSQIAGSLAVALYPAVHHWSHAQALSWLDSSIAGQFFYILIAEGVTLGALYMFLRTYGRNFKSIGLRRPRWSDAAYGFMAAPFYFLLYISGVALVSYLVPGFNVNQQQQVGFNDVAGNAELLMAFISLVVLPPLTEEILVRGFLYSSLKKAMPLLAAVITTSAIFAAAHLPEGGSSGPLYIGALDTFILSLILIYLREKTGGLWASITLHAIKNGVAFVALFVLNAR